MRIFTAVRHASDPARFYGSLWSDNFHPALRHLGHEVVESQVDLAPTSGFMGVAGDFTREETEARARTTGAILAEVTSAHRAGRLDLFLSYFYNAHFDPAAFDDLRRLGIPSINFFCNSLYQFELVAAIAGKADFSWHAERDARSSYLAVGGRPIWVQMGADPGTCHPVPGVERQASACFIGQRYADRDRWMASLIAGGVPVDIFGTGWGAEDDAARQAPGPAPYLGRPAPGPASPAARLEFARGLIRREGVATGMRRLIGMARGSRTSRRLTPLFAPHARGRVPVGRLATVMAAYELCLNFSNVWADGRPGSALVPHVRLRDFEAPMCRTCYLTGHTDEIESFYDVGRDIDTYRTEEELVDKARFYLTHPAHAERLRQAGYERAMGCHTWVHRFRQLFAGAGLRA